MYCTDAKTVTARQEHACTYCDQPIERGTEYVRWLSVDGGRAFNNKMHPECFEAAGGGGDDEWFYEPFVNERPERVR